MPAPHIPETRLQRAVNRLFRGKDAYGVLKTTVCGMLLLRLIRFVVYIQRRQGLFAWLIELLAPKLKKLPMVRNKLDKEMAGQMASFRKKFAEELTDPRHKLPERGMAEEDILSLMQKRKELDTKHWQAGKITGAVYHGDQAHYGFISKVFGQWGFANPLHPGIHPALRQMDSEVVRMVIGLFNGNDDCCGAFTTGGTESILMAMKAYRDWGKAEKGITDPNIVICNTAHAAFDKAGKYFKIFVKHAKTTPDMQVDLADLTRLVDGNTVAIVGSCCQYAHGAVDPIEELAQLALRRNIGLHVDCCLGGFLVPFMEKAGFPLKPFDFRVPGVTSISCDPHKYGFAPKGSSVVMFSNKTLRHHMYCYLTDWTGGIYATPTMTGSRAGGPVAATWAAMCKFGVEGYVETTKKIVGACRKISKGVEEIEGLRVLGKPEVCVVAITTTKEKMSPYAVADCMGKSFGWEVASCQNPPCFHLALTLPTSKNADLFLENLKEAVTIVEQDPQAWTSTAGVYGMAASLPSSFLEDAAATYLDAMTEALTTPATES
eukprot:CAMPEP_0206480252 /NCGR_PEP_ID=MMETSP0324_2-20121206/37149_1 /ASSEMBLY_ACC=CAM_ASM_000836 /TAXON_ID=2866 /ORGANISM="Crypthecodinium cohnii, Strain Seligo" /LENGTH=545 /DNA_ID=CAMNT_0053956935 /DNA_START=66 /DNA_END=1703 /DNA_ORIENTATION=+